MLKYLPSITHTHTHHAVQDVAFQLERVVAGMYIYYRQSYRSLKPAAVFPIEVELGIAYLERKELLEPQSDSSTSAVTNQGITESDGQTVEGAESSDILPPVDDLLLDLGLESQSVFSTKEQEITSGGQMMGAENSGVLPPVEDLLLDIGGTTVSSQQSQ